MSKGMRVALPGYNALTDTNADHFSLYTDEDWVLIKEFARGAGTVSYGSIAEITHSLGYVPAFLVYTEMGSNLYRLSSSNNFLYGGWRCYADTTKLYIVNNYSSTYTNYNYYIFYDQAI